MSYSLSGIVAADIAALTLTVRVGDGAPRQRALTPGEVALDGKQQFLLVLAEGEMAGKLALTLTAQDEQGRQLGRGAHTQAIAPNGCNTVSIGIAAPAHADGGADSVGGADVDGAADAAPPIQLYDVLVVGAGASGIAAAIQAARLGVKVLLVESTDWVGGQMTSAGVATMDGGNQPPVDSGLYREFKAKLRAYYGDTSRFPPDGKSLATCYWSTTQTCFEPHVGQTLLQQMLREAGVEVQLETSVARVTRDGDRITGAVLSDDRPLLTKVIIDSTEYGDLLPLAGVPYRVARSTSATQGGAQGCVQAMTYLAIVRRYPSGVPATLKMSQPLPGYAPWRAYFSTRLTATGSATYKPGKFPINWGAYAAYRGLPDSNNPDDYSGSAGEAISKTSLNWFNDYPLESLDLGLTADVVEDPKRRREIECDAKVATLHLLYYIQNDLGRSDWSVADDEGYDTPFNQRRACPQIPATYRSIEHHLPPIPYVRESRRIIAVRTLTGADILRPSTGAPASQSFVSAIAVGDYSTDLHQCAKAEDLEADLGEQLGHRSSSGPFEIPIGALIPERIDGLLAAEKNIGVSRLAAGAIRMQPSVMSIGQAAGALAALSAKRNRAPREIEPIEVQRALIAAGAAVSAQVFSDVPQSHPRWAGVQLVSTHQMMAGRADGTFDVEGEVSRAEGMITLAKLIGLDTSAPPHTATFVDLPASDPAFAAAEALYKAGYLAGCSTTERRFCPQQALTRSNLAFLLAKGLKLGTYGPTSPSFDDVSKSSLSYPYVERIHQKSLIAPCAPRRFCPDDGVTRGTLADAVATGLTLRP